MHWHVCMSFTVFAEPIGKQVSLLSLRNVLRSKSWFSSRCASYCSSSPPFLHSWFCLDLSSNSVASVRSRPALAWFVVRKTLSLWAWPLSFFCLSSCFWIVLSLSRRQLHHLSYYQTHHVHHDGHSSKRSLHSVTTPSQWVSWVSVLLIGHQHRLPFFPILIIILKWSHFLCLGCCVGNVNAKDRLLLDNGAMPTFGTLMMERRTCATPSARKALM